MPVELLHVLKPLQMKCQDHWKLLHSHSFLEETNYEYYFMDK